MGDDTTPRAAASLTRHRSFEEIVGGFGRRRIAIEGPRWAETAGCGGRPSAGHPVEILRDRGHEHGFEMGCWKTAETAVFDHQIGSVSEVSSMRRV
jgi:hypothetical protein